MQTGYREYSRAGRAKRGRDGTSTHPFARVMAGRPALPGRALTGRPATQRVAGAASVDDGVALLAHELDRVVHRKAGLAGAPGALPATERLDARPRTRRRAGAPVDVQHARLDLIQKLLDLGGILAVDAGRKPERTLVCERDRLAEGVDHGDGSKWHEQLVPQEPVRHGQLHDGRLDIEAVPQRALREVLTADVDAAVPACLGHGLLVALDGVRIDQRAEPVFPDQRITDRDLLGLLDQQADQLVPDRPLHVDATVRGALLAAEPEGRAHDPLGRLLEVGPGRDDGRVLAAHLHDAGPREPRGESSEELEADVEGAREDDPVDPRVGLELFPDGCAGTHDEIEDAGRQAGVFNLVMG